MKRQKIRKRQNRWIISFVIGLSLLFLAQSCGQKDGQQNFILVTLDTQRADYISAYDPSHASTPHIDYLAQKGLLFENSYSLIPITLPSHASIFFSLPPHEINNYNNGQPIKESRSYPSLVQFFKKTNYNTAAFVSLGVLKSNFGLSQGFNVYDDDFPKGRWYLTAEEINEKIFPWLEENKNQKFFLWIHYSDPHDPYAPPYLSPDLDVFLNGQKLGQYCLKSYKTFEVTLNLHKGINELKFVVNNEFFQTPRHLQARFDRFDLISEKKNKNIHFDYKSGWVVNRESDEFYCKKTGLIEIHHKGESQPFKLIFRGRLFLPKEKRREIYRSLYTKEVEYMDKHIGKLWDKMEELNLFQKTHILMVGDHGEGLGEYSLPHGNLHFGHIHFLYNIYQKVPLIYYGPDLEDKGKRMKTPVSLLDVGPTIMTVMGLNQPSHFQGNNLLDGKSVKNPAIYEETYKPEAVEHKFGILKHPWHLILTPESTQYELFNLDKDPYEKNNLFTSEKDLPAPVKKLKKNLNAFSREILSNKKDIQIDKETREMLKSLGYIK